MEEYEKEEARPRLIDFIGEALEDSPAMSADGLDEAIIGIGYRCGQPNLLVYDVDEVIALLMKRDDMDYTEAQEFFDHNIGGAWVGPGTPVWLEKLT